MKLQDKGFDKAILYLDQKLMAVIAQINSVTEGHGPITVIDTEESENGESGFSGVEIDGSGTGKNESSGVGSGTGPIDEFGGEGSGGGSSTTETTARPRPTDYTSTINNNVGGITNKPPVVPTREPIETKEPCNPNDLNCLPTEPLGGPNVIVGADSNSIDAVWQATKKDEGSAGLLLTTNLLLIAVSALASLLL